MTARQAGEDNQDALRDEVVEAVSDACGYLMIFDAVRVADAALGVLYGQEASIRADERARCVAEVEAMRGEWSGAFNYPYGVAWNDAVTHCLAALRAEALRTQAGIEQP